MSAADLVRATRQRRGLSQGSLARRCRTSQTHISRIERGAVSPSVETLTRILQAMGQRLDLAASAGPHGNQSDAELRAEVQLSPTEALLQAAQLSFTLTSIAASGPR